MSSKDLVENIEKQFGSKINLKKYSREQLEDFRNKIRTDVFQAENVSGFNELLSDEKYQKNKAILQLLNTRIKEMLGEDIKKLRDKMVELSEGKKGVKIAKHPQGSKKATKDYDGDGKVEAPKDEVWGSRAKAAAKAGKPFKEGAKPDFLDLDKDGNKTEPMKSAAKDKKVKEAWPGTPGGYQPGQKSDDKSSSGSRKVKGHAYGGSAQKDDSDHDEKSSKGSSEITAAQRAKHKAMDKEQERAGKDWEKRGHKRTMVKGKAQSGSPKDDDLDESKKPSCGHTMEVKGCKECAGMWEAKEKPSAGLSKAKKSATVKKAKAGGDIGKPGKGFEKVEKAAAKSGAKDPKAVAAAAMWKNIKRENKEIFKRHVRIVNESLAYLINEDEEEKAQAITAASDLVNDFTSWMQRVGTYQTKVMIELSDDIRHNFGAAESEAFKQAVGPALAATLETLTSQREAISAAVAALAGEQMPAPTDQMGAEPSPMPPAEEPIPPATPDEMNPPSDEFAASDAAAGAGVPGREMRESRFARKLAESHSIMMKLAK